MGVCLCGLLNSEIVITVITGCNSSFLDILQRLLQHYVRDSTLHTLCAGRNDCNIKVEVKQ